MFDIYAFGEVCLWIIPTIIIISIFYSATVRGAARYSAYGTHLVVALSYIFCIGVIIHEGAHRVMCGIFGVPVRETQYFRVEQKRTEQGILLKIGGHVQYEVINSVIVALILGFAPLVVNGLLVALLYYYGPALIETAYYPFCVYLGIALGLGACPSRADLTAWCHSFKKKPGRGILELVFLCFFGGVLYMLVVIWQVELWIPFTLLLLFLVFLIIQERMNLNVSPISNPKV